MSARNRTRAADSARVNGAGFNAVRAVRAHAARTAHALRASVSVVALATVLASKGVVPEAVAQEAGTLPGTAVLQGGRWVGARLPSVAQSNNGLVMTIEQTQERALLDWARFNVAEGERVHFEQQSVDWIALNRIFDSAPSEIAGQITARGQVWLSNQNGIVFKNGARINTHTLLATTQPVADDLLVDRELLDNRGIENILFPEARYGGFSPVENLPVTDAMGQPVGKITETTVETVPTFGDVIVERGAEIVSRSEEAAAPGKIMLFGVNVENSGRLEADGGQVILAAGEDIFLTANQQLAGSDLGNIRGIHVEVSTKQVAGSVTNPSSPDFQRFQDLSRQRADFVGMRAVNNGEIVAGQGTVQMVGAAVEQNGDILATTGVRQRPGRIDLRASYGLQAGQLRSDIPDRQLGAVGGDVIFGPGSVTAVLPSDGDQRSPLVELEGSAPGRVVVSGADIVMRGGARIAAPGGDVFVSANDRGRNANEIGDGDALYNVPGSVRGAAGSVTLETGAIIDVSGLHNVAFDADFNILETPVFSNELAPSPRQRGGVLEGQTVFVDGRLGAQIIDWTGSLAGLALTARQAAVQGGQVTIRATASTVVEDGAVIDISGGSAHFLAGFVDESLLVTKDRRQVRIEFADPDQEYIALVRRQRLEPGYIEGRDAGSVDILAPSMRLFGSVVSDTVIGPRQRLAGAQGFDPVVPDAAFDQDRVDALFRTRLPYGGGLTVGTTDLALTEYFSDWVFFTADEGPVTTVVEPGSIDLGFAFEDGEPVQLDPDTLVPAGLIQNQERPGQPFLVFVEDGFAHGVQDFLLVNQATQGRRVDITQGVDFAVDIGGSIVMGGAPVIAPGVRLTAPAGSIQITNGAIAGAGAVFSVAAPWVNDIDAGPAHVGGFVDGGLITFDGRLDGEVTFDARGGGWYRRTRNGVGAGQGQFEPTLGEGGGLIITNGGPDPQVGSRIEERLAPSVFFERADIRVDGPASFGAVDLRGVGDVVIGPETARLGAGQDITFISDARLNSFGYGAFRLGSDSLTVLEGADVNMIRSRLVFDTPFADIATGADLADFSRQEFVPAFEALGPTVVLTTPTAMFQAGSVFQVGAGGSLELSGADARRYDIFGTIVARGGTVTLDATRNNNPGEGRITIGASARLDVSGQALTRRVGGGADGLGSFIDGTILDGGGITVSAGELLVDTGAVFDISGTSGMLTVRVPGRGRTLALTREVGSGAGAVSLRADTGFILGSVVATPGGPNAGAGSLFLGGGVNGELLTDDILRAFFIDPDAFESIVLNDDAAAWLFFVPDLINQAPSFGIGLTSENFTLQHLHDIYLFFGLPEDLIGVSRDQVPAIPLTDENGVLIDANLQGVFDSYATEILALRGGAADALGGIVFDPDLTAIPTDTGGGQGGGFSAASSLVFVISALGNNGGPNPSTFTQPQRLTVGAPFIDGFSDVDTITLDPGAEGAGGNEPSLFFEGPMEIEARRALDIVATTFNGVDDLAFTAPYISFGGDPFINGSTDGLAPVEGGALTVTAGLIEVDGVRFGGFSQVTLDAREVRGGSQIQDGDRFSKVVTNAPLTVRADLAYPTQASAFGFFSDHSVTVEGTAPAGAVPLSAGGVLVVDAPEINQGGVLRAPFGTVELNARDTVDPDTAETIPGVVTLLPGSLTSASAIDFTTGQGVTLLYGSTVDGSEYFAPPLIFGEQPIASTAPPEKRVTLTGATINVAEGAVIDAAGGGDTLALEFVPGPLGRTNVLAQDNVFAISKVFFSESDGDRPLNQSALALTAGDGGLGEVVFLEGFRTASGDVFKAGFYSLLPAEFALTPGAALIEMPDSPSPVGLSGFQASLNPRRLLDGSYVVSGFTAVLGTDIRDETPAAFRLLDGGGVRARSEFFETSGNAFFSSERFQQGLRRTGQDFDPNPRLPVDGGFVTVAATDSLDLEGTIFASGASGARGGLLDVVSENIIVVDDAVALGPEFDDYLRLDPDDFSELVESVLFGGVRRQGEAGLEVVYGFQGQDQFGNPIGDTVGAGDVVIATTANAPLRGEEFLFAANQTVRFLEGAVVEAAGGTVQADDIALAPQLPAFVPPQNSSAVARPSVDRGAFARISSLGDIAVTRDNPDAAAGFGDVIVEDGVVLRAESAIILDATNDTRLAPSAVLDAGAVTAAAGVVSFGAVPDGIGGLALGADALAVLRQTGVLRLRSFSTFDSYGDVEVAATDTLILDGRGFQDAGAAPGAVRFAADTVVFGNSSGLDAAATDGSGIRLSVTADTVLFGAGAVSFDYADSDVSAAQRVVFADRGVLELAGSGRFEAREVTAGSGASYDVVAPGALSLVSAGSADGLALLASAGASLGLTGASVAVDARVALGSGGFTARALSGDVSLGANGAIDVSGSDVQFFDVDGFLPGGSVALIADNGDVSLASGSLIDVSGGEQGGDAGALRISVANGTARLDGTLRAAAAADAAGGAFALETDALGDFAGVNALLNAAGFFRARDFTVAQGDLVIDGLIEVDAFRAVTGQGSATVASGARIVTPSDRGGQVIIASASELIVENGALIDVSAKGAEGRGGDIRLLVGETGVLTIGAATFDVSGAGGARGGEVKLRAPQTGTGGAAVATYDATVVGGRTILEAFAVTDLGTGDNVIDAAVQNDAITGATTWFNAQAAGLRTRLGRDGDASFVIAPGIEIRSDGALTLTDNWNLAGARFDGAPGVLTLRAGGDLTFDATLSDGFLTAQAEGADAPNQLTDDESWRYTLVAGADFGQTDPLAVSPLTDSGDVFVNATVRTGTGDIEIAAAGSMVYEVPQLLTFQAAFFSGFTLTLPDASTFTSGPTSDVETIDVPGLGTVTYFAQLGQLRLPDGRLVAGPAAFTPGVIDISDAAIYTAGRNAPGVADFDGPQTGDTPYYLIGGGDLSVSVGGDIVDSGDAAGSFDWLSRVGEIEQSGPLFFGEPEFYSPANRFLTQTSRFIVVDRFRHSFGALGGGDIAIEAGGDLDGVSAVVPTTVRVAGGRTDGAAKTVHMTPGGDLAVSAGGDLIGGAYYVSQGRGDIVIGGSVAIDPTPDVVNESPNPDLRRANPGGTLFAIDGGQMRLRAGGDIAIGSVGSGGHVPSAGPSQWLGYTADSLFQAVSLGGDITYLGYGQSDGGVFSRYDEILPAQTSLIATSGSIRIGRGDRFGADGGRSGETLDLVIVDPQPTTALNLLARDTVSFSIDDFADLNGFTGNGFLIGWADPQKTPGLLNPLDGASFSIQSFRPNNSGITLDGEPIFGAGFGEFAEHNVHQGRDNFSRIYAVNGDVVSVLVDSRGVARFNRGGQFALGQETRIRAGGDIRLTEMTLYQHDTDDVSLMEAGGSIFLPRAEVFGAGEMRVEAGGEVFFGDGPGVRAVEVLSDNPALVPVNGASVTVAAGLGARPAYEDFFAFYLGLFGGEDMDRPAYLRQTFSFDSRNVPATAPTQLSDATPVTIYAVTLVNYMRALRGEQPIALVDGDGADIPPGELASSLDPEEYAQAVVDFERLDPVKQRALADRILFAELRTAGREAGGVSPRTDGRAERVNNPNRGYQAIGRLYPGAERLSREAFDALDADQQAEVIAAGLEPLADGASPWSGDVVMVNSAIRASGGGDVRIIAPGGIVQLASLSVADTDPETDGVVTQDGGAISAVTGGDYIINQSRTLTADGGNVLIWSSFGDIDAGRGRQTSLSAPPIEFPTDQNGLTRVLPAGLPGGAGIGTLDRVDGSPGGDVDLYAFRGVIDAGDAGIRVSRDLFIGAVEIRGLDNITVGGIANIDLQLETEGEVGALNLEDFTQAARDEAFERAFEIVEDFEELRAQTVLTGRVLGVGDCVDEDGDGFDDESGGACAQ